MKRGAERQLTKDDDPDDNSELDPAQGFQRADKKAIAARPMKGLPRRAGMSNPAPPVPLTPSTSVTPEPSAPASKFSGFAGFGASTAATTPFSFAPTPSAPKPAPPLPAATTPAPVSAFSGFGSSAFPASSSSSSMTTPAVASTASAATKTFASFFSTPSAAPTSAFPVAASTEPKVQPPAQVQNGRTSAATAATDSNGAADADDATLKAETTYYTALRGLNVSLLRAATSAIDADPFSDLTSVLERYKTLRQDAKADFDAAAAAASTSKSTPASKPAPIASAAFDFSKPPAPATLAAPTSAFSMPKPPSSFAGFSLPAASSAPAAGTGTGGFVPSTKIPTTLTFGPGASSSSTLPTSAFPASSSTSSPFGNSSGAKIGSGTGGFTFGSGSGAGAGTDAGKTEGSGGAKSAFFFGKTAAPAASPSVFSSNLFGVGDSSDDKEEKDKEHATEKAGEEKDHEKESKTATGTSNFFGAPSSTPSPFLFGGSSSSSSTPPATAAAPSTPGGTAAGAFGGFGKAAGSFGNPVGFQFASPPRDEKDKDAEKDAGGEAVATETTTKGLFGSGGGAGTFGAGAGTGVFGAGAGTTNVFGAGALGSAPKLAAPAFSFAPAPAKSAEASSGETTPAPEDAAAAPPLETRGSVHDLAGEGEEDEDTAHEVRSKVYKLVKDAAGVASWSDLGVGLLKVKVHKESGTRRLLLRNSSTGKVTVNFNIYKSMDPSVSKNTIAFIGHEDGETVSYRLRVKTHDLANGLKTALDREIEFVKGKAD